MTEGNHKVLLSTIKELRKYKKVLLLTCSNRGEEISESQLPKSSILAKVIQQNVPNSERLWKVSKKLFESDCVIFFASVRWGAANMFYQKLIERLNWINNRYIPYGESNIIKDIDSGFIVVGQHVYGDKVCELQQSNHEYYGFNINKKLYWNWNAEEGSFDDETLQGYIESYPNFFEDFKINLL